MYFNDSKLAFLLFTDCRMHIKLHVCFYVGQITISEYSLLGQICAGLNQISLWIFPCMPFFLHFIYRSSQMSFRLMSV